MYQNVFFGDADVTEFFCEMINRRKCFKPYFQVGLLLKLRIFRNQRHVASKIWTNAKPMT